MGRADRQSGESVKLRHYPRNWGLRLGPRPAVAAFAYGALPSCVTRAMSDPATLGVGDWEPIA